MLDTLETINSEVIITGDFNIALLKIADKEVLAENIDMLTTHTFFPKITLPTRLSSKHGTLIDIFILVILKTTVSYMTYNLPCLVNIAMHLQYGGNHFPSIGETARD